MTHTVMLDHTVVTRGSSGDVLAVVRCPSRSAAAEFAQRISRTLGGDVAAEPQP